MAYIPLSKKRKKGKDLTGQRFGRLVAQQCLGRKADPSGAMKTWWLCACDCGQTKETSYGPLTLGYTKSCGCLFDETRRTSARTHGMSDMPEHWVWLGMRDRCTREKSPQFKDWGGRGIKVCDKWMNSFQAFFAYVGPRPTPNHSIHRIDNDGNYEPGNVKWATRKEQASNKRPCKLKSHCSHGHEFTPENTRINRLGHRKCRECWRRYNRNRKAKLAA